jgi:PAS domain S-box-containing protein
MSKPFTHYRFLAFTTWLLAVVCSLAWNTFDNIRERDSIAHETARAFYKQILAARHWNLRHGGVYVYTTEHSPPNLFLPENRRTIKDNNGKSLTLINPAYMTRQIAEISEKKGAVLFHITSLTPLRKNNAAYPWEIPWLQSFDRGETEQGAFMTEDGKKVFRYMAPLVFKDSCLPCHTTPKAPDTIRGAISVSFPSPFKKSAWPLLLSHLFVALTGITCIALFGGQLAESRRKTLQSNRDLAKEIDERKETEKELRSIKETLELTVNHRTAELRQTNTTLDKKIQEQQRIEAALVAINDEFIQIFNSAPDGMHVIDRDYNVIRVNRAYCELVGKETNEIQGHKCYDVFSGKFCHTEECPLTQIVNGAKRVELDARKVRVDGTIIPCLVTATPFRDPHGKLTGIIEVTRDISNWKDIERSLSATAKNLRLRNAELEDFSHVISHDLQEPLMLIEAFGERIRTKCATELPEQGHAYLEHIENSTQRMKSLIDGLLLYSRISSKAKPFDSVDLNNITNSVLEDLTVRIEKQNALISVSSDLPVIEADPLQMRQLFQNIIGNSLKYHHQQRPPEITITLKPFSDPAHNQTHIRINIQDNGIGFDANYQEQIFDIFQRLHTRRQFEGTGIGLSICKKIAERHCGTITATGMPDEGATFTITLPRTQYSHEDDELKTNSLIDIIIHRR